MVGHFYWLKAAIFWRPFSILKVSFSHTTGFILHFAVFPDPSFSPSSPLLLPFFFLFSLPLASFLLAFPLPGSLSSPRYSIVPWLSVKQTPRNRVCCHQCACLSSVRRLAFTLSSLFRCCNFIFALLPSFSPFLPLLCWLCFLDSLGSFNPFISPLHIS
jgi:hypothetical protein